MLVIAKLSYTLSTLIENSCFVRFEKRHIEANKHGKFMMLIIYAICTTYMYVFCVYHSVVLKIVSKNN